MAINGMGVKAVSFSGAQAGINTSSIHGNAEIISVNPTRILKELKKGAIAVVAGFQGADRAGDTTTLGRGGSDFTAVALARALKAEICELYTDVKGVYTANPALVPQAKKIKRITYDALLALARSGTEVRQLRAVAYARKHRIALHLRSSFENETGTLVGDFRPTQEEPEAVCLAIRKGKNSSEIHIIGVKLNAPKVKCAVRKAAADGGHVLLSGSYTPRRITLRTGSLGGEELLRTMHKVFIS
jgi:aspartate kinase